MSYKVSEKVDAPNIFLAKFSEVTGNRWDSFYYRPELVALENRIQKATSKKLRDFTLRMAGGATPSTKEAEIHYTENVDGVSFIRVQNLSTTGLLNLVDCKRISRSTHEGLLARSQLSGGELLVKITGVGRMAIASVVPEDFEGNINQHIVAIRTGNIAVSETLAAYLNLDIAERLASRHATGGTRPALDYPALLSLPVFFDERISQLIQIAIKNHQQKNAQARKMLDSIDDVLLAELGINLPSKPDAILETRIFILSFQELTGKRLDCYRYQEYQQQLRASVKAASGPSRRLRDCVTEFIGGDWGSDDAETYDTEKLQRCLVVRNTEFDNDYNLNFASGREKYRLIKKSKLDSLDVQPYDLLIEKSGGSPDQPVGRAALLEPYHFENGPLCFSNFLSKIRIDSNLVDPAFLFLWLQASHRIGITQSMQSQTNSIRNLIFDEYLDQDIPVPSMPEQISIRNRILKLQEETKHLFQEANEELSQAKREIEALILGEAK